MSERQKEISIAEFFEKNRHLLGFDNPRKALLTTVKEAVDNALDACEEAGILPQLSIEIVRLTDEKYRIIIEDNGPGIVKEQIPKIFGKLLYGSKFHRLKQSRGQQGIGISAAALYGQLTTGKPIKILSKIGKNHPAHVFEIKIDSKTNEPKIHNNIVVEWIKEQGTKVELDIEAAYTKGVQSVEEYIKQTAIVNPHATLIFTDPDSRQTIFPRATEKMPKETKEIKPHPYGVELGMLIKMLHDTKEKNLGNFLKNEFSRMGEIKIKEICEKAVISPSEKPISLNADQAERIIKAIRETDIMAPSVDCISPIGEELLLKGIQKEVAAEFFAASTRRPSVYRGNPFQIEAAIAYGGNSSDEEGESKAKIMRFANRVPLIYQQGSCAVTESIKKINWKAYGLRQPSGSIPFGPVTIEVHMASVWTPFTSEAKEAIAHYPEIISEIKLALQEVARKLKGYLSKKIRVQAELKKKKYIEKYIPHISGALKDILDLSQAQKELSEEMLKEVLENEDN